MAGRRRSASKKRRGGSILGKIGKIAGAVGSKLAEKLGPKILDEISNPNSNLRTNVIDNLEKNSKSPWIKRLAQLNKGAKMIGLGRSYRKRR